MRIARSQLLCIMGRRIDEMAMAERPLMTQYRSGKTLSNYTAIIEEPGESNKERYS